MFPRGLIIIIPYIVYFGQDNCRKQIESKDKNLKSIIHKYEKRIRKTQRVANQTELKLKKQQASLLHFKIELSRHISKLDELSATGNEKAKTRLKKVQMKISQIDKIVPYLEKYVAVNRQAESQTISVLKESCTVELRQHSSAETMPASLYHEDSSVAPALQTYKPSGPTAENQCDHEPPDSLVENPYATLSDIKKEKELADCNLKVQSNYAELNFSSCQKTTSRRPPSVNYVEVQLLTSSKTNVPLQKDGENTCKGVVPVTVQVPHEEVTLARTEGDITKVGKVINSVFFLILC